jgi:hypothetical protein
LKSFVRNPEAVAALLMTGAAVGAAAMVRVKLLVALPAVPVVPVAEREIADNAPVAASMGTVPEIRPLVVFRDK